MLVADFPLVRKDEAGQDRALRVRRFDVPSGHALDPAVRRGLLDAVQRQWLPMIHNTKALWERSPDGGWDWDEDVLPSVNRHLVTQAPEDGVLVVVESDDGDAFTRLEGLARLIDGWAMVKHAPKPARSSRRGGGRYGGGQPPVGIYLDTLAVNPNNRIDLPPPPRIRGLGPSLLAVSLVIAAEQHRQGFLALHAAPEAETWYRENLPGIDFWTDLEEFRMAEAGKAANAPYTEVAPIVARAFLEGRPHLLEGFRPLLNDAVLDRLRLKCDELSKSC